ncbi:MAG: xanthine dehydrogenase family protein subunit M [Alphaproteobacteria bacterium]|nr:xanthine dehydrogenase family protein subunit M [Alphaproteobacteria bacterium]
MKSPPFAYVRATSLDDVFGLKEAHGDDARILAGGQSLMPTLNMRLSSPEILVDINHIDGLAGIAMEGDVLTIGALTRHVEVEGSDMVASHAPLVAAAMPYIAHPAIRNRGTIGGSLALADPAAELPACMVALGAEFTLASKGGERRVAAASFFKGLFETEMKEAEVLTRIHIPPASADRRSAFEEIVRRQGDFARAGVAATANLAGSILTDLKLVYFAVADRPILAEKAGAAAEGADLSPDGRATTIAAVQAALADDIDPAADLHASVAMKAHLASVLAARVLTALGA